MKRIFAILLCCACLTACAAGTGESSGEASEVLSEATESVPETSAPDTTSATEEPEPPEEKIVYEIDSIKPLIALTFDDGPNTTTTNEVLDKLYEYQVPATFFLIGNNISDSSAKSVKRAYSMGCEIANHSKTHSYMTEMTTDEIKAEIEFTNEKIKEITGEEPKFFRPPYISVDNELYDAVDLTFICGVGANDWDPAVTVEKRAMKIIRQAKDGAIILLHDAEGNSPTVEALDTIIPELLAQGYQFVTVSELFAAKGVALDPNDTQLYTIVEQAGN